MTKETKIIAGVLAGAALGAVVALVVSNDNSNVKDSVGDFFCRLTRAAKEKLDDAGNYAKDAVSKAKA